MYETTKEIRPYGISNKSNPHYTGYVIVLELLRFQFHIWILV